MSDPVLEQITPTTDVALQTGPRDAAVMPGFVSENSWRLANRIGQAFAASSLVPQAYQGNVANCIVALEMANRMGASPLMVMQNLYIVHGNPGWSSKFLIACFNQSGRFSALRYEWNAERTSCRAWATERATGERLVGPTVTVAMAKEEGWSTKSGSKWKTMPELMLMYRSAAFMIRTYAPELSMGLKTDDEIIDTVDEIRPGPASGIDAVRAAIGSTPNSPPAGTPADAKTGEIKPARSYAQFADAIQKASSADTAALELDGARDVLPEDQLAELGAVYAAKWGA